MLTITYYNASGDVVECYRRPGDPCTGNPIVIRYVEELTIEEQDNIARKVATMFPKCRALFLPAAVKRIAVSGTGSTGREYVAGWRVNPQTTAHMPLRGPLGTDIAGQTVKADIILCSPWAGGKPIVLIREALPDALGDEIPAIVVRMVTERAKDLPIQNNKTIAIVARDLDIAALQPVTAQTQRTRRIQDYTPRHKGHPAGQQVTKAGGRRR